MRFHQFAKTKLGLSHGQISEPRAITKINVSLPCEPRIIEWKFALSVTYRAFISWTNEFQCYIFEKQKEGQKHFDANEVMAIVVQREREKALLADTSGKEKVDSDISECSADKTKQNNIHSESTSSQETSLVVSKHGKRKKYNWLNLIFQEPKGLCIYLVTITSSMDLKL